MPYAIKTLIKNSNKEFIEKAPNSFELKKKTIIRKSNNFFFD